mmetsp:Transcript_93877/g.265177  ORF Transcript_93877/g.265177 Transcript_93877/m.265177 type:complete len:135 (+) Transcript_93877:76-480(+)
MSARSAGLDGPPGKTAWPAGGGSNKSSRKTLDPFQGFDSDGDRHEPVIELHHFRPVHRIRAPSCLDKDDDASLEPRCFGQAARTDLTQEQVDALFEEVDRCMEHLGGAEAPPIEGHRGGRALVRRVEGERPACG